MLIKFQKILDEAIIPHYAHQGDAGMDIFSVGRNDNQSRGKKKCKNGGKNGNARMFCRTCLG